MTTSRSLLPLSGALALGLLGWSPDAHAASSSSGEEYLSITEAVTPNILFLVDMSSDMDDPCAEDDDDTGSTSSDDTGGSSSSSDDTGGSSSSSDDTGGGLGDDTGTAMPSASSTTPCITSVMNAIDSVTQHYDWARYGVVGTADDSSTNEYYPVVPLGTSYAELSAAVSAVSAHSDDTRNLAEALTDLTANYLSNTDSQDGVDDDGDGFDNDWAEAAIEYWCQETHVIVISQGQGVNDKDANSTYLGSPGTDVLCDSSGITTGTDEECLYDNSVYYLYNTDLRSDLSDDQNVVVHTVGIGVDGSSIAENLFGNAADQIGGAGMYSNANDSSEILSSILELMSDIRTGTFSRSTPVVSASGDYMIYTFYELDGDSLLAEGHIRAYEVDDDPTSSTYGQVDYTAGSSDYGGAIWDGGDLLVSRPVTSAEQNPDDRDGFGKRDIYTFWEPAVSLMSESTTDYRQGFDYDFVSAVGADATALSYILDTTVSTSNPPCADDDDFDLDKDGCLVDEDDLQALVDFVRGLPEAEYTAIDEQRGTWKLGDSPHSIPVVVEARNNQYALEPSYRKFLKELEVNENAGTNPDIVLVAANDGMLHAFALEDSASTTDSDEGEELWAWIPGYVIYRDDYRDHEWSGGLMDLMQYGRTFLFDGTPVVEDIWIDDNGDGEKDCTSVPGNCEWRRVVVVQQGKGGPVTLALDITTSKAPKFLWEQVDEGDDYAQAYSVSRPSIVPIYDESDSSNPIDRYVALWGSGRGVPYTSSYGSTYYDMSESNLYMWAMGDDYWGTTTAGIQEDSTGGYPRGYNMHPEDDLYSSSTLDSDSDAEGHYEYAYISAALAAVDVDSDGDADTVYFPVTASYSPLDEGGSGPGDTADPGSTWLYKACIDTESPGDFDVLEFYDPVDDGGLSIRPEVYYAATTAWHSDGSLGIYWGTGTPYDRTSSEDGYFFAVKDTEPLDCSSDYLSPITDCGAAGVYALAEGEGLTAEPLVYAGVVYFSTWTPEDDLCDGGAGRLYGLDFEDCNPGLDTDGDGDADTDDDPYIEEEDAYISGVAVTDKGTLFYGTSNVVTDGSASPVGTIQSATDPFLGTETISWFEVY